MGNTQVSLAIGEDDGLSQLQRIVKTFFAPSETFEDIKRGNRSWWLPFLIIALLGAFQWAAIAHKVTWKGVAETELRNAPEAAQRMIEQLPPDQRAEQEQRRPLVQAINSAVSPISMLLVALLFSAVLLATTNFAFNGKANYRSILAVVLYSSLVSWPLRRLLTGIALFAGQDPDSFNINNPIPTNLAALLNQDEIHSAFYSVASQLDVLTIWSLILLAIGLATVARVKRTPAYIIVFGWWVITILFQTGVALLSTSL